MSFLSTIEGDFTAFKAMFSSEVWPYIESTLEMFASQEGTVIFNAALANVALIGTGNFAAAALAVGTDALAAAPTLATQDAQATLLKVQTALQLVKANQSIVAPSDPATAAAITATATPVA
jgi:hypothetical protein